LDLETFSPVWPGVEATAQQKNGRDDPAIVPSARYGSQSESFFVFFSFFFLDCGRGVKYRAIEASVLGDFGGFFSKTG